MVEVKKKTPRPISVGYWLTALWFVIVLVLLFASHTCPDAAHWWSLYDRHLSCATANQIGDFLAGAFAPLAFLWLVATVLVQAQELSAQREELELTRAEMKANRGVAEATQKAIEQQAETAGETARFIGSQTELLSEQVGQQRALY